MDIYKPAPPLTPHALLLRAMLLALHCRRVRVVPPQRRPPLAPEKMRLQHFFIINTTFSKYWLNIFEMLVQHFLVNKPYLAL